ncbi:unnamed protein product [Protopolystoma xenopodis]|uniref:Uncharacterized protein n=1 Tax=Protopolystoma xenopodis TaxID=117903 RepID=A0A448WES6_9PLAT|nr:unnamed protein product [Protopolystoma xenopodis]
MIGISSSVNSTPESTSESIHRPFQRTDIGRASDRPAGRPGFGVKSFVIGTTGMRGSGVSSEAGDREDTSTTEVVTTTSRNSARGTSSTTGASTATSTAAITPATVLLHTAYTNTPRQRSSIDAGGTTTMPVSEATTGYAGGHWRRSIATGGGGGGTGGSNEKSTGITGVSARLTSATVSSAG